MPKVQPLQNAFSAGEISPRLAARLDLEKYPAGMEICENAIPLSEGGVMRRSGTRYVAEVKLSSVKGRLKRFEFSITQAYILELCDTAMRFCRYQGQITVANTDSAISNGTFTSNITGWDNRSTGAGSIAHDATNGRLSLLPGGTGATDIGWAGQTITTTATNVEHVLKFRVIGAPGDKIEFQVGTSTSGAQTLAAVEKEVGYHCVPFTPTTTTFYIQFRNLGSFRNKTVQIDNVSLIDNTGVEIDTPWPEAELFDVEGPQSADTLYLFHDAYPTHKLQRYGHTSWSLVEVAWEDGPYLDQNTSTTTLLPSAASGLGITLTLSSISGVNGNLGWQSTDVGRLVRYKKSATWGYAVITSITSTLIAVADVRSAFEATPTAQITWRLGAWSGTTGYPQQGAFFEERLYAAGTTDEPQTFWGSQTADFENFKPDDGADTIEADDALSYTLSSDNINAIRWISSGEGTFAIGTASGEWIPLSEGAAITPLDISVRKQTSHGSARIRPVRIDNVVLFVQKAKRKIREFRLDPASTVYTAPDMTRLAQHITSSGIVEMDYAEEPESIVWAVRGDGQLLSMTYRRDEDVVGWARHKLGGVFLADATIKRVWHVDASSGDITEETKDANGSANADWTVFPATEAVGDYVAFGHTGTFTQLKFDYANGTAGVVGVVSWEFWNGTAWTALSGVTDGTTGFTAAVGDAKTVTWTLPTNWATTTISSDEELYYVRAKITTVYTTNPVLDQGYVLGSGHAVVESVAVIPGADGSGQTQDSSGRDEVWLIVKRTINSATKRYIEFFEQDFADGDNQEDAYYLDSLLTYDGTTGAALTGYSHLEGATVGVWADGAILPNETVSSGAITLDAAAAVAQVGLRYTHKIKPLKISAGNPLGTPLGKIKRIYGLTFVLLNSHTVKFGPDSDHLETRDFRVVSDPVDAGTPLFTGEQFFEFPGDYKRDARIVIEDDNPAPFILLALAPEIQVNPIK